MIVFLARDIQAFVMYCVNGTSRSSLLIESTDSMIYRKIRAIELTRKLASLAIISIHERRGEVVSRGFWSGARVAQLLFSLNEYLLTFLRENEYEFPSYI